MRLAYDEAGSLRKKGLKRRRGKKNEIEHVRSPPLGMYVRRGAHSSELS